tara:strand:- start:6743 stop:8155 length:1413 start_codon:yes stop_codon:yes gene_type:complete
MLKFNKITLKKIIKQNFSSIDNIVSLSIVGSFNKKKLSEIGDLDIVVIIDHLNKTNFDKCIRKIKLVKKILQSNISRKIKINSTFGPVKYDYIKYLTFHIMIYDIHNHKKHVLDSPFTCYDWERSNSLIGKNLRDIYPVYQITYRDFFNSKRSYNKYITDLSNRSISYQSYYFEKNNIKLLNHNLNISGINIQKFCNHILINLINNLHKFFIRKNELPNHQEKNKYLKKICINKENYNNVMRITKKYNQKFEYINITKKFLYFFHNYINKIQNNSRKLYFIRHQETKLNSQNIFIGNKLNPIIIKKNKINLNIKYFDNCYSSPLKRSLQTANLYFIKNKIIKSKYICEINYGVAEGMNFDNFFKKYPKIINKWKQKLDPKFPKGENSRDVLKRLKKFLKLFYNSKLNDNSLIVSHNVILRSLIGYYFNIKKHDWYKIQINHNNYVKLFLFKNNILIDTNRKNMIKFMKKI